MAVPGPGVTSGAFHTTDQSPCGNCQQCNTSSAPGFPGGTSGVAPVFAADAGALVADLGLDIGLGVVDPGVVVVDVDVKERLVRVVDQHDARTPGPDGSRLDLCGNPERLAGLDEPGLEPVAVAVVRGDPIEDLLRRRGFGASGAGVPRPGEIGRASCRERV